MLSRGACRALEVCALVALWLHHHRPHHHSAAAPFPLPPSPFPPAHLSPASAAACRRGCMPWSTRRRCHRRRAGCVGRLTASRSSVFDTLSAGTTEASRSVRGIGARPMQAGCTVHWLPSAFVPSLPPCLSLCLSASHLAWAGGPAVASRHDGQALVAASGVGRSVGVAKNDGRACRQKAAGAHSAAIRKAAHVPHSTCGSKIRWQQCPCAA